jgi:hypothetical protein
MVKKRKQTAKYERDWVDDMPVVFVLKDCRQLSENNWQGPGPDGTIHDIKGGSIPERLRLFAIVGGQIVGIVRLIQ